ncbi:MAG TPA: alpha-1,2-fucosyltransferase [Spirochaetia bacterium]|nr:alpha-1,2-fucosyltransferase [Spirochaetia bacterium]
MIIINLTGGLGNQMFQYAFGKNKSISLGIPLKVHFTDALFCTKRGYSLDCFKTKIIHASSEDISSSGFPQSGIGRLFYRLVKSLNLSSIFFPCVVTEENYQEVFRKFDSCKNYYIEGYWQGDKYLGNISELSKLFTFSNKLSFQANNILKKINSTNSVAIHVRRGDYVSNGRVRKIFEPCGVVYYRRCIKYLNKKSKSLSYFVFSDDFSWAKKNIKTNCPTYFVSNNKAWEDMYLMSRCQHNIIANSSFSWWAAQLNKHKNKIVLLPNQWTTSKLSKELSMVSPEWKTIKN